MFSPGLWRARGSLRLGRALLRDWGASDHVDVACTRATPAGPGKLNPPCGCIGILVLGMQVPCPSYCGWTKSCTTLKPWEVIVRWHLHGNHDSRVSGGATWISSIHSMKPGKNQVPTGPLDFVHVWGSTLCAQGWGPPKPRSLCPSPSPPEPPELRSLARRAPGSGEMAPRLRGDSQGTLGALFVSQAQGGPAEGCTLLDAAMGQVITDPVILYGAITAAFEGALFVPCCVQSAACCRCRRV